jgi:hypothetical protein
MGAEQTGQNNLNLCTGFPGNNASLFDLHSPVLATRGGCSTCAHEMQTRSATMSVIVYTVGLWTKGAIAGDHRKLAGAHGCAQCAARPPAELQDKGCEALLCVPVFKTHGKLKAPASPWSLPSPTSSVIVAPLSHAVAQESCG